MVINLHVWKRTGYRQNVLMRRIGDDDDLGREISQICKLEYHRRIRLSDIFSFIGISSFVLFVLPLFGYHTGL